MPELNCKIDGCDYSGSPQGLRSHVHGKKGDDDHREAAENRAHHDWYPAAYGLDEEGSDDDGRDDPGANPSDTPTEGGAERGSEGGRDGEGENTLETDPSEGGTESPDDVDEYAEQWEAVTTPTDDPSEGASGEGSDGEGDDTPESTPSEGGSDGGDGGLGAALVLGTGALALAVLLRGRGSNPSESPDESGDSIPDEEGADSGSGWSQDGGPTPIEGGDSDELTFTPTET